jgi:hypothetical protein
VSVLHDRGRPTRDGATSGGTRMRRRRALALLAAAITAPILVSTARADGDPASDYLLRRQVFFPYDAKFPGKRQAQFAALVAAANRAGFKIRVALIASSYDLGSVTALNGKPRTYARFLGEELAFVYKQRLLVVMRKGFGFNWPRHPAAPAYAVLAKIPIQPGNTGLLDAAQKAVQRLAAVEGVKVAQPANRAASSTHSRSHARLIIIVAALAAVLLAVATRLALRRRRR